MSNLYLGLVSLSVSNAIMLMPVTLAQSVIRRAAESQEAWIIVSAIVASGLVIASVFAGLWVVKDAKRRGHNGALWLVIWSLGPAIGAVSLVASLGVGQPATGAVALSGWVVLGAGFTLLLWIAVRRDYAVYDADGRPIHPKAVLRKNPPFVPGQPPPSRRQWQPVQQAAQQPTRPTAQPTYSMHVPPAPTRTTPSRAEVRCPACRTVFEYAPNPSGPSRVECPTCRLAGTI